MDPDEDWIRIQPQAVSGFSEYGFETKVPSHRQRPYRFLLLYCDVSIRRLFINLLYCDVVLLDELLTLSSDAECGSLVKMLVAAIAGSNHAPEAQTSIVTEVSCTSTSFSCYNNFLQLNLTFSRMDPHSFGCSRIRIGNADPDPGKCNGPKSTNTVNLVTCLSKRLLYSRMFYDLLPTGTDCLFFM
jgi:hypothetical protein